MHKWAAVSCIIFSSSFKCFKHNIHLSTIFLSFFLQLYSLTCTVAHSSLQDPLLVLWINLQCSSNFALLKMHIALAAMLKRALKYQVFANIYFSKQKLCVYIFTFFPHCFYIVNSTCTVFFTRLLAPWIKIHNVNIRSWIWQTYLHYSWTRHAPTGISLFQNVNINEVISTVFVNEIGLNINKTNKQMYIPVGSTRFSPTSLSIIISWVYILRVKNRKAHFKNVVLATKQRCEMQAIHLTADMRN